MRNYRNKLVDLWQYLVPENDCHVWTRARYKAGYGRFTIWGESRYVHRLVYFMMHPYADKKLHVLHKCDNPPCANPEHLFLGTAADNMRDRDLKGRCRSGQNQKVQTHCKWGHPFAGKNLRITKIGRICRQCINNNSKRYHAKLKVLQA